MRYGGRPPDRGACSKAGSGSWGRLMKVTAITSFVARASRGYDLGSGVGLLPPLPASGYSRRPGLRELYGTKVEACLTRVETDSGLVGWGESQAPVGPEIAQAIVTRVLAPVVLGQDPSGETALRGDARIDARERPALWRLSTGCLGQRRHRLVDLTGRALGVSQPVGRWTPPRGTSLLRVGVDRRIARGAKERRTGTPHPGSSVKPFLGRGLAEDEEEAVAFAPRYHRVRC